jgi:hypothetical protein
MEGPMKNSGYGWRECYVHAVLETNPELRFVQICEAVAAIEQRRLSPIDSDDERRELENVWDGVRALISEHSMRVVC